MTTRYILPWLLIVICGIIEVYAQSEHAVGQRTFTFEDRNRNRKLITELWYPTSAAPEEMESAFLRIPTARDGAISAGRFPLILFSHGTGGGRLTLEWFCAGLASHGYVVAAVDHFGNTFDNPIPEEFVKFWERPQDIRFILDRLMQSEIANAIDSNKIGAAGFSLGGYTAIALAGATMDFEAMKNFLNTARGKKESDIPEMPGLISLFGKPEIHASFKKAPPLKDKRVKSVFVMSPAVGQSFPDKSSFKDVSIPVYIVAAANDQIAPLETNAAYYAKMLTGGSYQTLGGKAGHYVFLNEAKEFLKQDAPVFFADPAGVDRKVIHDQTLELALEHFRKTLK